MSPPHHENINCCWSWPLIDLESLNIEDYEHAGAIDAAAELATKDEHSLTVREAFKRYPTACFWAMDISFTIVMEGYDTILISNLYAYPSFKTAPRMVSHPTSPFSPSCYTSHPSPPPFSFASTYLLPLAMGRGPDQELAAQAEAKGSLKSSGRVQRLRLGRGKWYSILYVRLIHKT